MSKILIGEAIQILIYFFFGLFVTVFKLKKPLYFALGFVIAIAIPSILVGYGVPGMKGLQDAGNSGYELFRSLPIANGIWGIFHLLLAFAIGLKIKEDFNFGLNIKTVLIIIGFCFVFIPLSIMISLK